MADTPQPTQQQPQAQGQPGNNVEPSQSPTQADPTDLSSKYAHLARKEKSFREVQRQFQAERDAFNAERDAWKNQNLAKYQGFEERVTKDPLSVLEERGISRDQLATLLLNQENPDMANLMFQLQQENKSLRERIDGVDKRFQDEEKKAYEGAVNQIRNDAKIIVDSAKSDFELIGLAGEDGIEAIVELCKIAWAEDQVLLSVEEAAKQVEQELLERSMRLAGAAKVKAKYSQQAEPQPGQPEKTPANPLKTQPTKTLNSQSAQATSKPMSARERAILAFQGKLNQ